jgi:hypothetical protein
MVTSHYLGSFFRSKGNTPSSYGLGISVFCGSSNILIASTSRSLVLHVNITQLDKCHMFLSTVVSVACLLQLSQVSHVVHKCRKHQTNHTAMMKTLRRHLEYLRHLIWRRGNDLLKSRIFFHLKGALKQGF